jgi:rhodanese-related sulfurtransferase
MNHEIHVRDVLARGARVVDVREPDEFVAGHIAGAELVPLGGIERAAKTWNREQEIVVVCRSGGRSGRAAKILTDLGFTRILNMAGGMLAWNDAGLPITKGR